MGQGAVLRQSDKVIQNFYAFVSLLFLLVLWPSDARARAVLVLDMKALMERSQLVLVGKIRSVTPSGITTELTYPTWHGVVFEWLKVEVEVIDSIKGTKKGEDVKTLMLSSRGRGPFINPPGMVRPKVGQHHLLCLLPTNHKDVFASITAPFDDDQRIFLLDRNNWEYGAYKDNPKQFDGFPVYGERYKAIWELVNDKGEITADGAEQLRTKYKAEIATPAPKGAVIYLNWKKAESETGWQWNVPDREDDGSANAKGSVLDTPIEAEILPIEKDPNYPQLRLPERPEPTIPEWQPTALTYLNDDDTVTVELIGSGR